MEGEEEVYELIIDMNTCQINKRVRIALEGLCQRINKVGECVKRHLSKKED